MKILVIGSGGREHAIVRALKQSQSVTAIYAAPGSSAIATMAENIPIAADQIDKLADWALQNKIDLTVVGPELPLVLGIADVFTAKGLKIFGPQKSAALLEGSKIFTKEFFAKYQIPTAKFGVFNDVEAAFAFLEQDPETHWVIKADGLAAGKGVLITQTIDDAKLAVERMMVKKEFGKSGEQIVIEEFLDGEEASFMVVCDGETAVILPSSQDHKRLKDHDVGPNTGGMGAYSPAPVVSDAISEAVMQTIIYPTIKGLNAEGRKFIGVLYAGLMIVGGKAYALEYNVRLGDPETEVILPLIASDFAQLCLAAVEGRLKDYQLKIKPQASVGIVLAAENYPGTPVKGDNISGLDTIIDPDVFVYHAGSEFKNQQWLSGGGRVLVVNALGDTVKQALDKAYKNISQLKFRGMQYRKDIAHRILNKESI